MIHRNIIIFFLVLISGLQALSQPESGGVPRSFRLKALQVNIPMLDITAPNADSLAIEDRNDARHMKAYRVGVTLPVSISVSTSGTWNDLPDGGKLWMLRLQCGGAKAIGLYYEKFILPAGSDLFIYNQDRTQVIGAFSEDNNSKDGYATRPVAGDVIILEYYQPANVNQMPDIQITGLMYAYRSTSIFSWNPQSSFNTSGSCEVNVNCPEGANWVNQKRGVFIVLSLTHGSNYLCTGTLLNNTSLYFDQLLLTANHCAEDNSNNYSTASDFNQYIFFMNYEAPGCNTPSSTPAYSSFVGSKKLASTHNAPGGAFGTDFLLLRMSTTIADSYRPFFNGWDCNDVASSSGVAIHHPEGDVKKISTYNTPTVSSAWDVTPNTHWMVKWAATADGQGVTEAGSSGAPLFNASGLVMGALSGGDSYCSSPTEGDYFGKLSYSYTSDGQGDTLQLKPWIDPANLGLKSLSGRYRTPFQLAVKVLLEGPLKGGTMSNTLNTGTLIPKSQPYITSPWAYAGTESVTSVPAGTVDWILVELRQADAPSNATSTTTFARRAAFLKNDGTITDLDGISPVLFSNITLTGSNSLYVVIRHRNHLAIMSSAGVTSSNGVFSYDFTTSLSQAYGGGNGYKQVGSAFAMINGDTDQNGSITVTDYNAWATAFGFTNSYNKSDLDMDGSVLVSDYNKWAVNFGMANAAILKSATTRSKYFSCVPE